MKKREITSRFVSDDLAHVEEQLLINQLIEKIELKKSSIILQRIKERFDIDFDIDSDFDKLSKDSTIDHDHIYFEGNLLVSFEYPQPEPTFDHETVKAFYGFNYK